MICHFLFWCCKKHNRVNVHGSSDNALRNESVTWARGRSSREWAIYALKGRRFTVEEVLSSTLGFSKRSHSLATSVPFLSVQSRTKPLAPLRADAEEGNVHGLVLRHAVADALGAVADELRRLGGSLSVDGLGVALLGGVGGVLLLGKAENVGPLLQLLLVCIVGVSTKVRLLACSFFVGHLQLG